MARLVPFWLAIGAILSTARAGAAPPPALKLIDEKLEAAWKREKVEPSAVCNDHEFIRRASLDLVGRIATPDEIDRFLSDPHESRRTRLVDRLLDSDEHPRYWG